MMQLIVLLASIISVVVGFQKHHGHSPHHHNKNGSFGHIMDIDHGLAYGVIMPFTDEWHAYWKNINKDMTNPSPFQMWLRCIGHEVRGYFFYEDLVLAHNHFKEAIIHGGRELASHIKMTADGVRVKFDAQDAGGEMFFNISKDVHPDHNVDIIIEGFKHFVRFPVSMCSKPKPPPEKTRHIMHIHLRDFSDKKGFRPMIIDGVANHMAYHRCALKLDKYEVVVQSDFVPLFEAHPKIAHAIKEGWITLLVRNPLIPSSMKQTNDASNCYYQAYAQNMAILQHWKQNVRLYFFDSDEYLGLAKEVTPKEYMNIVFSHSKVGFRRYMVYKDTSKEGEPDWEGLSLTQSNIAVNQHVLRDEKIVVDPDKHGCVIVHWAQCGEDVKLAPIEKAYIMHFENLYVARWNRPDRNNIGAEYRFNVTPVAKTCDPALYDWKSPLPSFHHG